MPVEGGAREQGNNSNGGKNEGNRNKTINERKQVEKIIMKEQQRNVKEKGRKEVNN
jgi:hypothetical protein